MALHFEVTRKNHATAVSEIYEAVNREGSRYFTEVLTTAATGPWLDAFKRDMAAVAQLKHPCLLELLEVGALPDGRPVLIWDRPQGITLARWLERGHVAPTDPAMDLLSGLAHALGSAHDIGVSHGALTADDVVLVEISQHAVGFPRLRGFAYRWLRMAGGAGGSIPAQRTVPASRREVAADIAALAVLADRLLTPLRNSEQVTSVIRAATLLGEDGRFATPAAFIEALEEALDPESAAREMTDPTLKVPWSQRSRGLRWMLATAAGVVFLAAGVHALVSARNAPPPPAPVVEAHQPPRTTRPAVAPVMVRPAVPAVTPAPAPAVAPAPPPPVRAPASAAARPAPHKSWRVWSEREQRLIEVDEHGEKIDSGTAQAAN